MTHDSIRKRREIYFRDYSFLFELENIYQRQDDRREEVAQINMLKILAISTNRLVQDAMSSCTIRDRHLTSWLPARRTGSESWLTLLRRHDQWNSKNAQISLLPYRYRRVLRRPSFFPHWVNMVTNFLLYHFLEKSPRQGLWQSV